MKNVLKIILFVAIILIIGVGIYAINQNTSKFQATNKERVSASFYPLYFFASEIGKDKAEVSSVIPNGVEPHDYDPTAQDIAKIQESNFLVLNGAGFEPWANKMQADLQDKKIAVVNTSQEITLHASEEPEKQAQEEEKFDPHVWLSPALAKQQVEAITNAYIKADSQNSNFYRTNTNTLKAKLDELDTKYKTGLQTCRTRNFITSHAAFGYLANSYNLKQVAIAGLSPEEEPSPAKLAEVAKFVKANGISYIFFESLASPKLSQTISNETGAKTLVLDPIEGISNDNKAQGKNYFSVMENNLKNLQTALQCTE